MQLELRKSLRPKRHQAAVVRAAVATVGEVDLVAADQQFDREHAAAAERIDDARRDRPRGIERGGRQLVRLPRLQHVAVGPAVPDRFAEVHRGPRGPVVRTVSSVTSSSTSTTRLGHHPCCAGSACPAATARCPRGLDVLGARQHRLAVGDGPASGADQQREARVSGDGRQFFGRAANQNGTVGNPSSSAASLRSPSRSSAEAGGARGREHLDAARARRPRSARRGRRPARRRRRKRVSFSMRAVSFGAVILMTAARRRRRARERPHSGHGDHVGTEPLEHQRQLAVGVARTPAADPGSGGRRGGVGHDRLWPGRVFSRFSHRSVHPARPSAQPDVDVAPPPVLAGLRRRMTGWSVAWKWAFACLMRARVTAADVATRQAHPQVRPGTLAELVAFLAYARGRAAPAPAAISGRGEVFARSGNGGEFTSRCRRSPPHADQ